MQQNYKKFIPCIYLYQGSAVKCFEDRTVVSMNAAELAKYYSDNNADEILVFDLSNGDKEHEENLDVLKAVCAAVDIPVIGAGNVHRMEDIKKLIYAGCKKAALNYSKPGNVEITEEVSLKFGKDKIAVCIAESSEITKNRELLEEYVSDLILVQPFSKAAFTAEKAKNCLETAKLPVILCMQTASLEKILEVMAREEISGLSGEIVNENAKEIQSLKNLCAGAGIAVNTFEAAISWAELKKNSDGMVPVVVQDYKTDEVLMVAYMNEEAYENTLKTGKMTYFSRSRSELWLKGETSGHFQYVQSLTADCDLDTILARVSQVGAACHTGNYSCFFHKIMERECDRKENPLKVFEDVLGVIKDRKVNPKEGSYTNYLFDKGVDKILKKLGEEATEIVIAAKNPNPNEIKYEISDFLYHMMVLMVEKGVSWEEITTELANR
ncbi:MAG: bifunctional phosphoribosyl-AMP cyclohydrolase/phosphoribosyl-ATP diphosphatase HisIE [Clostridiales bacterium]|nr:bifunctional phosphoribosyl-AMP cyclohydrolase/phosphoribosyl-ATP diphosphatase HisIE [Clostridiales bacterium]